MHLFKIMQKSLTFWNSKKWTIKNKTHSNNNFSGKIKYWRSFYRKISESIELKLQINRKFWTEPYSKQNEQQCQKPKTIEEKIRGEKNEKSNSMLKYNETLDIVLTKHRPEQQWNWV